MENKFLTLEEYRVVFHRVRSYVEEIEKVLNNDLRLVC